MPTSRPNYAEGLVSTPPTVEVGLAARLSRATNKTAVWNFLGTAWRTVGAIVERVVGRRLDSDRLERDHYEFWRLRKQRRNRLAPSGADHRHR